MKKILFIAILGIASTMVSCSNDAENLTPSAAKYNAFENDLSITSKETDTVGVGETGGQGGTNPPPRPK